MSGYFEAVTVGDEISIAELFQLNGAGSLEGIESFYISDRSLEGGYLTRNGEVLTHGEVYGPTPISELSEWSFVATSSTTGSVDEIGIDLVSGAESTKLEAVVLSEASPILIADEFRDPLGDGSITAASDGEGYKIDQYYDAENPDITPFPSQHLGVDWNGDGGDNNDIGMAVYAIADGVVTKVDDGFGLGNFVVVSHKLESGEYVHSLYAHLNDIGVAVGQTVTLGSQIGELGDTGTDFAHLHLEISSGNQLPYIERGYNPDGPPDAWIDPIELIDSLWWQTIELSETSGSGSLTGILQQDGTERQVGDAADRDRFKVSLEEGVTYEITVEGESVGGADALTNPYFSIRKFDPATETYARIALPADDTEGPTETLTWTAPTSGDYFIYVGGGGDDPGSVLGGYRVNVVDTSEPTPDLAVIDFETIASTGQSTQEYVFEDSSDFYLIDFPEPITSQYESLGVIFSRDEAHDATGYDGFENPSGHVQLQAYSNNAPANIYLGENNNVVGSIRADFGGAVDYVSVDLPRVSIRSDYILKAYGDNGDFLGQSVTNGDSFIKANDHNLHSASLEFDSGENISYITVDAVKPSYAVTVDNLKFTKIPEVTGFPNFNNREATKAEERVYLAEGSGSVSGTPEQLNGDVIVGFDEQKTLLIKAVQLLQNWLEVLMGSAILNVDTDGDGISDFTTILEGDFEGAEFNVNVVGENTEITVDLPSPNSPPVALDDAFTVDEDQVLLGNVLDDNGNGADSDPDGDRLTVSLISGPAEGFLTLNDDGSFSYKADADAFDLATPGDVIEQSFTYQIDDGNGEFDQAIGTIFVTVLDDGIRICAKNGKDDVVGTDGGEDILEGGNGKDQIFGLNGADQLFGGNGKDLLDGGEGPDKLYGGNGKDILIGGLGDDELTGGKGDDTFVFALGDGTDTLVDYEVGKDVIELVGLTFEDLSIGQSGDDATISADGEFLAVLIGVDPLALNEADVFNFV